MEEKMVRGSITGLLNNLLIMMYNSVKIYILAV